MAQFKRFSGLRTYDFPLQRDMRELERWMLSTDARLARLTGGESINTAQVNQGNSSLAAHAFTHANARGGTGTDPLTPYDFALTGAWEWTPSDDFTPVTINASAPPSGVAPDAIANKPPRLWYIADDLAGADNYHFTGGETWVDRSGNNTPALPSGTLLFAAAGSCFLRHNALNGYRALENESGDADTASIPGTPGGDIVANAVEVATGGAFTEISVYRVPDLTSNLCVAFGAAAAGGQTEATLLMREATPFANAFSSSGGGSGTDVTLTAAQTGVVANSWHIAATVRNTAGVHKFYHDGVDLTLGTPTSTESLQRGGPLRGANTVSTGAGTMLAEYILYKFELSATEVLAVVGYLAGKYGLAAGGAVSTSNVVQINALPNFITIDNFARMGMSVDPSVRFHLRDVTAPQVRIEFNASSSLSLSVSSTGVVTYDAAGTAASHVFLDPVTFSGTPGATAPFIIAGSTTPQLRIQNTTSANELAVSVSAAGAVTYDATGASAGHTFADAVTVSGAFTVNNTSALNGVTTITSTTSPQFISRFDASNRFEVSTSSAGVVNFDAVGASSSFTVSDPTTVGAQLTVETTTTPQVRLGRSISGNTYIDLTVDAAGLATWSSAAANNIVYTPEVTFNGGIDMGTSGRFDSNTAVSTPSFRFTPTTTQGSGERIFVVETSGGAHLFSCLLGNSADAESGAMNVGAIGAVVTTGNTLFVGGNTTNHTGFNFNQTFKSAGTAISNALSLWTNCATTLSARNAGGSGGTYIQQLGGHFDVARHSSITGAGARLGGVNTVFTNFNAAGSTMDDLADVNCNGISAPSAKNMTSISDACAIRIRSYNYNPTVSGGIVRKHGVRIAEMNTDTDLSRTYNAELFLEGAGGAFFRGAIPATDENSVKSLTASHIDIKGFTHIDFNIGASATEQMNIQANLLTFKDAFDVVVGSTTGTKIATATTQKLGFYNATPIVQPSAYTQTYSTADKTHAALTSATLTDSTTGTANTTVVDVGAAFSQATLNDNFADVVAQINALRVDVEDIKQLGNSIVDDLQALGLVG